MSRIPLHISAFIFASLPSLAWAEEAAPVEGAAPAHEGGGLPQFNTHTWPSQIFWLVVTFGFAYFFFSKLILPSMTSTLTARADKISGDIKAAEHMSHQAQLVKDNYESELKKASGKASADMKEIDEAAKAKLAASLQAFRDKSQAEISKVEQSIEKSKAVAMEDMQKIAAEIAAQAAQKIAGIPADSAQAENVVRSLKNKAA